MHPTEADLIRYLENTLSRQKRNEVEVHLADCPQCAEQVAAIRRLPELLADASAPTVDERVLDKAARRPFGLPPVYRYAIAASVVLAVGIASVLVFRDRVAPTEYRGAESGPPSIRLQPDDGGGLSYEARVLRWSKVPSALAYEVSVMEESGTTVWSTHTSDTSVAIPSGIALQRGNRYLWTVEALFPDDTRLRSKLHLFIISP